MMAQRPAARLLAGTGIISGGFSWNSGFFMPKVMRQLDADDFEEYKVRNHPVGACQITITTDKINNRTQECKRLRPLFSCLKN
jgi:uncharacterized protein YlaI